MNTHSKPTWMTLFSLCAMCVAAFFFVVPLLPFPIEKAMISLIIAVALFDVVALWIMANRDALEREFSPQKQRDTPYRYYGTKHLPVKKQTPQKPDTKSDDDHKDD